MKDESMRYEDNDESHRFGFGSFRPSFLQWINKPCWFLLVLSLFALSSGTALLGIFLIVLPQIEKRFSLTATDIGLMAGANDVAAVFFGVFISYYGDFANKIRWIAYGGFVTAIGLLLFILPHFIAGRYVPPSSVESGIIMCEVNRTQSDCPEGSAVDWYYMAIFCISQFIAGAGILPMFSMAPAYFEENVSKKLTPIYIGLWNLSVVFGPLLGFALSDPLISLYVDITQPEGVNLTTKDPRWIGNWWIGFLVCACLLTLYSAILLGFPRHLQTKEGIEKAKSIRQKAEGAEQKDFKKHLKEFLVSSKELMQNRVFLCHCMALILPFFAIEGVSPFYVKVLLFKYGISAVNVGKAVAIASTPGIVLGSLFGSLIVSMFDLKKSLKKSALLCIIGQFLMIIAALSFLIPGCGNPNLAGLNVNYGENLFNGSKTEFQVFPKTSKFLQSSCNDRCDCSLQGFLPLCGSGNISYLDPCHAGCTGISSHEPLKFANCSCVTPSTFASGGTADVGFCDQGCRNWEWFLTAMGINTLFFFLLAIPSKIVLLRCVPANKQSFAIGMQYISLKIFANVPGPIVMGKIIDSTCEVWQHLCGKAGSCSVYDINKMELIIVVTLATAFILAVILFFVSWWYCGESEENETNTVIANVPGDNSNCEEETSF